jgi:hypothetical protein
VIKLGVGICAVAAFGFLFMRSVDDTRGTPYTVEPEYLRTWTVAIDTASKPNDPFLVLRPVPELAAGLFRQVFARAMESLNAPVAPAIPVVLRGEFDRVVGDQFTPESLVSAARAAGLESATITPRCLVYRRVSEPGSTRQVYFVLFDAAAVAAFRRQLALDAGDLLPILFIAGSGPDFNSWLPQRLNTEPSCLAPVEITRKS